MGKCIHCHKEITLKEGEVNCPNCGMPPYYCWNCYNKISGEGKQCKVCGFFPCFNCGVCGEKCRFSEHMIAIKNKEGREIIEYFYDIKLGLIRKSCPKGVPISYAKAKLRNAALKLKGFNVKSEGDKKAFNERYKKMIDWPVGKTWSINKEREEGFYGAELREISNLGICLGKVRKNIEINKKTKQEYELFERVEEEQCHLVNRENLIVKQCPKCRKNYEITKLFCDKCVYEKGDKKGLFCDLKERKSSVDYCQLNRKDFKIKKEDKNEL